MVDAIKTQSWSLACFEGKFKKRSSNLYLPQVNQDMCENVMCLSRRFKAKPIQTVKLRMTHSISYIICLIISATQTTIATLESINIHYK